MKKALRSLALPLCGALLAGLCACGGTAGGAARPAGASSAPAGSQSEQLLFTAEQAEHIIIRGSALQEGETATLQAELGLVGPSAIFIIEHSKDEGLMLRGVAQNSGQNLAANFDLPGAFTEDGALKGSYYAQVTTLDLDADSELEVVACVGNKATEMQAVVYRYVGGDIPFEPAGVMDAQVQLQLRDGEFLAPNTNPALGVKYGYQDGQVVLPR